jgi:hypothetical protein
MQERKKKLQRSNSNWIDDAFHYLRMAVKNQRLATEDKILGGEYIK